MRNTNLLIGAALGAGVVYLMDPQSGRRRRAMVRDKVIRATHITRDALEATSRDAFNHGRGVLAAARARWQPQDVPDEVLIERVRAKLGHVCSHPHALQVLVSRGNVTLRGPLLADEAPAVLRTVYRVRGVKALLNQTGLHDTVENVPTLQGDGREAASSLDAVSPNWAPSTRAFVTAAGLAATGLCVAAYARR